MSSRWFKTEVSRRRRRAAKAIKRHQKAYGQDHEAFCGTISTGGHDPEPEFVDYCTCQVESAERFMFLHPRRRRAADRTTLDGYVQGTK